MKFLSILVLATALGCVVSQFSYMNDAFVKQPAKVNIPHYNLYFPSDYSVLYSAVTRLNADNSLTFWNFQNTSSIGAYVSTEHINLDTLESVNDVSTSEVDIPLKNCQKPLTVRAGFFVFACMSQLYTYEAATGQIREYAYNQFKKGSSISSTSIKTIWAQGDFLYVVFADAVDDINYTYYVQGVSLTNPGVSRFHTVALALHVAPGYDYIGTIKCGQIGKEDRAVCAWTIPGKAVMVEVDLRGAAVGEAATTAVDPQSDKHYVPKQVLTLDSGYVIIYNLRGKNLFGCSGDIYAQVSTQSGLIKLGFEDTEREKCPELVAATSNGDTWNLVWTMDDYMPFVSFSQYDAQGKPKGPSTKILRTYSVLNFVTLEDNSHYVVFYIPKDNAFDQGQEIYIGQIADITSKSDSAFLALY